MSRPQFVYLHVGNDISFPTLLVRSIRVSNKDAVIYQCSDLDSPAIAGVDHISRVSGNAKNLMTFRLQAFSELNLTAPAIYLDTDMLVVAPLDVKDLLGGNDVALCQREFGKHDVINIEPTGIAGFRSAQQVAKRLEIPLLIGGRGNPDRRVQVHDMVEIFAYTTMRSPERWVSRDG